jgi:hypothetical protein
LQLITNPPNAIAIITIATTIIIINDVEITDSLIISDLSTSLISG